MSIMKFSIITVVLNCCETIGHCLESVRRQSFPTEHIIIDGGSTDGTLDILGSYEKDGVARVISEPDNGIYDAMNKGIAMATGDIVGILNADDFLASPDVFEMVAGVFADGKVDSSYGDLDYVDRADTDRVIRRWRSGPYRAERFYNGWMPPHPTFFARRQLYERYGRFNTAFGSAADYELMLRFLLRYRITAAYIPHVLVKMRTGGTSNASIFTRLKANRMDRKAWEVNGLRPRPWTLLLKPFSKIAQFL